MRSSLIHMTLALTVATLSVSAASVSLAQDSGSATADTAKTVSATKAQRKAERKEARAKKNAELKKLEGAGYNPARGSDPHYPQDIQNAEKKAGIGAGASQ